MLKIKTFKTLLIIGFVSFCSVYHSQINKKVFFRNDRFVLEYTKQTLPGDKYGITSCKLFEFFEGKLVHTDSSLKNDLIPTCKHFLNIDHCLEGESEPGYDYYYFQRLKFGNSVNKLPVYINYNEDIRGFHFLEGNIDEYAYLEDQKYKISLISVSDSTSQTTRIKGSINSKEFMESFKNLAQMSLKNMRNAILNLDVEYIENHLFFDPSQNNFYRTEKVKSTSKLKENQTFDINGNVYETVEIDGMVWMAENLRSTHFQNGDEIRKSSNLIEWSALNSPSISQGFDSNYSDSSYGYFYNGYAVVDDRNACPIGYYVPDKYDITKLYNALKTEKHQIRLKSNGNVVVKRYPRVFAPIVELTGLSLTGVTYATAGAIDIVGNLAWATLDVILSPITGWKKTRFYQLDAKTKTVTAKSKIIFRPFPTFTRKVYVSSKSIDSVRINGIVLNEKQINFFGSPDNLNQLEENFLNKVNYNYYVTWNAFSLFTALVDEEFNLIYTPGRKFKRWDYLTGREDEDVKSYIHLDRLKNSDGKRLTNEFKFNLSSENTLLLATINGNDEEMGLEFVDQAPYIYPVVLPYRFWDEMKFWGNLIGSDHELETPEFMYYLNFPNRNGAKVRCVKY